MIQRVERIDDSLRSLVKPELQCIESIPIKKNDVLIFASGFEDRSPGVLKRIASGDAGGFTAIIIDYKPFLEDNKLEEISNLCSDTCSHKHFLTYDRRKPQGIGDKIEDLLREVKGNIFVDISAMSRLLIVQIIVHLGKSGKFSKTKILYSEAVDYPPYKDEVREIIDRGKEDNDTFYRQMFLSAGVFEVTIVPELSSVVLQGQPIRLVAFPSFNIHQLPALRGEIQPYYINLIHGIPPLPGNAWRPEAIKRINQIESILNREEIQTSTLDYRETLDYLLKVYADHGELERIVIAPIGSKMQTAAVGIFRTFMDDVHIVYPTPRTFSTPGDYTKGVKAIYKLNLKEFQI